jgi:hypothetical protein
MGSAYIRLTWAAVRRPSLIPAILGTAWAFRANGWFRRPPFLPIPPKDYVRWRLETAYGDPTVIPPTHEFERYIRWGSAMRRRMKVKTTALPS